MRALLIAAMLFGAPAAARADDRCDDDALSEAAADLLLTAVEPTAADLAAAARRAGSDAVALHALLLHHDDPRRLSAWLTRLAAEDAGDLVCGEAVGRERRLVLASLSGGHLEAVGDDRVRPLLSPGFVADHLVVRGADGTLLRLPAAAEREVRLPREVPRPVQVQLVARGPRGPRPVAERVLGGEPPAVSGSGGALVERVRALRRSAGALPLRHNRLLVEAALAHAQRVCAAGVAAHQLPGEADPVGRLRARGVRARIVGEVVARAGSPDAAATALLASPSHRMTLLDRRFTDVGYATTSTGGGVCVVGLLAAWPRVIPP